MWTVGLAFAMLGTLLVFKAVAGVRLVESSGPVGSSGLQGAAGVVRAC